MNEKAIVPDCIEPFYETPEPGKELELIKEDDATLKQNGTEVNGTVQITQKWSPMGLNWNFTGAHFDSFSLGEVELQSKTLKAKEWLFNKGHNRVALVTNVEPP